MKQQFKNVTLTRVKVRNNILKVWNEATEADKFDWYQDAYNYAQVLESTYLDEDGDHVKQLSKTAGIIAALSPMVSWDRNKQLAEMIFRTKTEYMPCLKANARKAKLILESDGSDEAILNILKGAKTSAFYLNIRYPEKAIALTMDRHAVSICIGEKIEPQMTAKQYEFFSQCYRWTAAQLGISPLLLQSATWVVWRRRK